MAKLNKISTITLVDTQTNTELKYLSATTPKKSTFGNSAFGTLSPVGYKELQAQGYKVYEEADWRNLLRTTFKLSEQAIGSRGERWDTPEARQRYKAYIDGVEYAPALSPKALARAKAKAEQLASSTVQPLAQQEVVMSSQPEVVAQPEVVTQPKVVAQPTTAPVMTDTTPNKEAEDEKIIAQIKGFVNQGIAIEDITKALKSKLNDDVRATLLMAKATKPTQQPIAQKPAVSFAIPQTITEPVTQPITMPVPTPPSPEQFNV